MIRNLILIILLTSVTALSQNRKFSDKSPEEVANHRADKLKSLLVLDDYQHKQVYEIILNSVKQIRNLREQMNNNDQDKVAVTSEIRKIRSQSLEKIKSLLTSDQMKKFEEMIKKKQEKRKHKKRERERKF